MEGQRENLRHKGEIPVERDFGMPHAAVKREIWGNKLHYNMNYEMSHNFLSWRKFQKWERKFYFPKFFEFSKFPQFFQVGQVPLPPPHWRLHWS